MKNNTTTIKRSTQGVKIPDIAAGIASMAIPGLGQIIIGEVGRGIILLGSILSMIVMFIWRIDLLAHLEPDLAAKYLKALALKPFFITAMSVGIASLWVWIAFDAYKIRKNQMYGRIKIFTLVIAVFFLLGYQIGEINPYRMITKFPDTLKPLSKVLWPWEAAFTHEKEILSAKAAILSPCNSGTPPPKEKALTDKPYIIADPTCGELSSLDKDYKLVPGTEITLTGGNFTPNSETQIWWVDPIGNRFRIRQDGKYLQIKTDKTGSFKMKLIMPYRLMPPSQEGEQIHHIEAVQETNKAGLIVADPLRLTISRMIETIFMGMIATLFGIIFAIPVSFLAARNLMSGSWVTKTIYYLTRTIINIIRSIEPLIWALIAVVWVGLGPFAGIIALTFHSVAALTKLYSEAIESIDPGPIEAIRATGANHLQTIIHAVIPQMIPPFVSFSIYRWDINVRMSTVIGLVGGGGIGFILIQYIRLLDYKAAGIAVWFIAITVATLDYVSSEIRKKII